MCDLDLEPCEVFNQTEVRARKPHVCDCCGGTIGRGDIYVRQFSVFQGDARSEKECAACAAMVAEFAKVHGQSANPSYMPYLLRECITIEEDEGNTEMASKWRAELEAMEARRGATNG